MPTQLIIEQPEKQLEYEVQLRVWMPMWCTNELL